MRETDTANTETVFRIIQSIPSPKAEPFKRWLAQVGYERIEELLPGRKEILRSGKGQQVFGSNWIDSSLDLGMKDRDPRQLPVQEIEDPELATNDEFKGVTF